MNQGTVKFFNAEKGYGFIKSDKDGETDVFVHVTGLNDGLKELQKEQKVTYDVEMDKVSKKSRAVNVSVVNASAAAESNDMAA